MTAFDQWWANHFGVEWYQHYELENKNCKAAWNAALDAAISVCREVTEWDDHCTSGAKECDTLIQKLKSE